MGEFERLRRQKLYVAFLMLGIPISDSSINDFRARFDLRVDLAAICISRSGFLFVSSLGAADLRNDFLSSGGYMCIRKGRRASAWCAGRSVWRNRMGWILKVGES